jgi:HPr kinase/phosphorylase
MFDWSKEERADRLGLEDETHTILGVTLPKVRIPIRPGRSVATIIEVAARNHVLKRLGRHSAREVAARIDTEIARRRRHATAIEEAAAASPAPVAGVRTPGEGSCTS